MRETISLAIGPRDPVVARDGRPFGPGAGVRMRSTDWINPTVLAGSLRTLLGKLNGGAFNREVREQLKLIELAGPFPEADGEIYLPAPRDIELRRSESGICASALRPDPAAATEGGVYPPLAGMQPVAASPGFGRDEALSKPMTPPAYWSLARMTEWLGDPIGSDFAANLDWKDGFLDPPHADERIHVHIDPRSGAHKMEEGAGMLFSTVGLTLEHLPVWADGRAASVCAARLLARVSADPKWASLLKEGAKLHPLGGERRVASWSCASKVWDCPPRLAEALGANPARIRMVLASPGLFDGGWRPAWLKEEKGCFKGAPPGFEGTLRLAGAIIPRWQPISGFSLEPPTGPKAVRWMVPSGAVYFFELEKGSPSQLAERWWLHSVADREEDRRDGFALALWGIWDYHSRTEEDER